MIIARNVASIAEATAAYVGRAIADMEARMQQERSARDAEHRAALAELATERAAVEALRRELSERLANLKDGADGKDGRDADPEVIRAMVGEAVAAIPVIAGKDGADGRDGKDGRDGVDGKSVTVDDLEPVVARHVAEAVAAIPVPRDGKDGRDGLDGKDGEPGQPGPVGALPMVKEWQDRVYFHGDVVSFHGALYQASCATGKAPGHEDWTCIVRAGRDGQDGRSFRHVGTYDPSIEYGALDVVNLNGGAFLARQDNPGSCPGEGWALIAAQGKQGRPGPKGDRGEPGRQGIPAQNVIAASVDDAGVLRLVNGDGSVVECDLYPLLSRVG